MEWITEKKYLLEYIKKFRYVFLVLLAGILLMTLPESEEKDLPAPPQTEETQPDLQVSLGKILSQIDGAGRVEVLLTQSSGEEIIYQINEDVSAEDIHREAVLTTDSSKNETGLVKQIIAPQYLGAVVLCQGADQASIRLSIVEAVMSVTGLTSDCITVLKMK